MGIDSVKNRIRVVLSAEADAISAIPITDAIYDAVDLMSHCNGKIIISGMGKAGIMARKMAATLSSTGTPSIFLHPGEAQHGDLGIISPDDILFVMSTSGKTREVIEMVKLSQNLYETKIKVISITSHLNSNLRSISDVILDLGIIAEPCPLGLTPSASTTAMLALCDAIAIAIMDEKGITKHDYAKRHHGGYLGAKARIK